MSDTYENEELLGVNEEVEKPADIRVIIASPSGEFNVDRSINAIVHCSDKHMVIPKEKLATCNFIKGPSSDQEIVEFKYPATVLENLVRWVVQYGVKGVAVSPMTRPCLYRDFSYVLADEWDSEFYHTRLCGALNQRHYLTTMTAAEEYGVSGLLDFMVISLGCRLRNEEDNTIMYDIMGIDRETKVTEEDLDQVPTDYPWFDELTKPMHVK